MELWKDRSKIVAGEQANTESNLVHLIGSTVNDSDQFCIKEREEAKLSTVLEHSIRG
jgi:hypothetical protein